MSNVPCGSDRDLCSDADSNVGDAYAVGYGKPPLQTRFAKGASGNPRGRKPGSKNLGAILDSELNTKVTVTEKGERRSKRKREVFVTQLVNKAIGGDLRAASLIMEMLEKREANERTAQGELSAIETVAEADAQVVADFLRRVTGESPR